jgi:hypothetical protein
MDIFPADDFGVREGYRRLKGLEVQPTRRQMVEIGLEPLSDGGGLVFVAGAETAALTLALSQWERELIGGYWRFTPT